MRCGVNLTSPTEIPLVRQLVAAGNANFCEILVDNFLHLDPLQMRNALGNVPVGFHIMWSKFIERDSAELSVIARRIREWIDNLEPTYVSDHIAQFTVNGRSLPLLAEIPYQNCYEQVRERVLAWQQRLGCTVLFENFPSTLDLQGQQIDFYTRLQEETGCGLLFDCSNAVVAQFNCDVDVAQWIPLARTVSHFHIAGFRHTEGEPSLAIDTHDVAIASESFALLERVLDGRGQESQLITAVVERDANIDIDAWTNELIKVRSLQRVAA